MLVVCRVGSRSAHAAAYLHRSRASTRSTSTAGCSTWHAAGRPLVTDDGPAGHGAVSVRQLGRRVGREALALLGVERDEGRDVGLVLTGQAARHLA